MKFFLIVLTVMITTNLRAQTAADSVKTVINNMFTAMRTADTVLLKSVFADNVIFQTIGIKEGKTIVKTENAGGFISLVGSLKPGVADERIEFGAVHVDGSLAAAWTPYRFYLDGQFNSFQLVRFKGDWKIQYLVDTRRKTGCVD